MGGEVCAVGVLLIFAVGKPKEREEGDAFSVQFSRAFSRWRCGVVVELEMGGGGNLDSYRSILTISDPVSSGVAQWFRVSACESLRN